MLKSNQLVHFEFNFTYEFSSVYLRSQTHTHSQILDSVAQKLVLLDRSVKNTVTLQHYIQVIHESLNLILFSKGVTHHFD